ncbi:MAG: hypothetical protein SGI72_09125 [Planctomycetota bacterium]|nr:hypothetical protein [Planctomycetota bacterium]
MSNEVADATIRVPSVLVAEHAAAWFETWSSVRDARSLHVILPSDARLDPAGQSWLSAGIAGRAARGKPTSMAYDPSSPAARELHDLDFFHVLGVELMPVFERPFPEATAVKLRRIETEKIATELARETADCLADRFARFPSSRRRAAAFLFEELGVNIVQHSGAPRTGFGLARGFASEHRLQLSFCDAGVGFLASAQRHPEFAGRLTDEGAVLSLALEKGVSFSNSTANSGFGLSLLRRLSDELDAHIWLASGNALLHRWSLGGKRVTVVTQTAGWRGAWVCLDATF